MSCIDGRSIKVPFRSEMLVKDIKELLERPPAQGGLGIEKTQQRLMYKDMELKVSID